MNLLGLILDVTVIGMLAATIAYAIRLNRRLATLREGKEELELLVSTFTQATKRAEAGVESMKLVATETGEMLQKVIDRGQSLRDELQFMVEAADSLATRLENAIGGNRPDAEPPRREAAQPARQSGPVKPQRPPAPEPAAEAPARTITEPEPPPPPEARSRAERELMQALENLR